MIVLYKHPFNTDICDYITISNIEFSFRYCNCLYFFEFMCLHHFRKGSPRSKANWEVRAFNMFKLWLWYYVIFSNNIDKETWNRSECEMAWSAHTNSHIEKQLLKMRKKHVITSSLWDECRLAYVVFCTLYDHIVTEKNRNQEFALLLYHDINVPHSIIVSIAHSIPLNTLEHCAC